MIGTLVQVPVLLGVDVTEVGRVAELIDRYGAAAVRRVCDDAEIGRVGLEPARLAAVFALKESAIKAMGGRPAGFRWQSIGTADAPAHAVPAEARRLLDDFVRDVGAGSQLAVEVSCTLAGRSAERAARLLPGPGEIRGAGSYLTQDGHMFAAVCFWKD
ncbi:4'-phosphopantetheinyl transferase superfamily protein [Spongisporangium articulatum]|uniref:4'-phosphopantetheinyl transferase superfamily protein n=1 Tax=Spongisporangium articulatum TaxID=3362603 RepID=A0ABW8AHK2_9ACTN